MAITFDPIAKRIVLDSASVTSEQIWSRWCDWATLSDNSKYGAVLSHVGGDELGTVIKELVAGGEGDGNLLFGHSLW